MVFDAAQVAPTELVKAIRDTGYGAESSLKSLEVMPLVTQESEFRGSRSKRRL